jgi:hypothetical protein
VQTFLPYPDMMKSLQSLDYRRLGKQRSETKQQQILLRDPSQEKDLRPGARQILATPVGAAEVLAFTFNAARLNHPACAQWWDCAGALAIYHDLSLLEWKMRGYQNTMKFVSAPGKHKLPDWWGDEQFHSSHRSNLLRKDPVWYGKHGWTDDPEAEYYWPSRDPKYQLPQ